EPRLEAAEYHRSTHRATNDLTAYDLFLRARAHTVSWEREGIMRALDLLEQALTRDADYGMALAFAAHCHMWLSGNFGLAARKAQLGAEPSLSCRMLSAFWAARRCTGYCRKSAADHVGSDSEC